MSSEIAFIAALRTIATHPAARGLADDAAVLELGGEALVITHDMMLEGVHWLVGQDAADVAWKLLAVNLSDLAAKGAEPIGVLLGYTLGHGDARFLCGLTQALAEWNVPLLGGDTVGGNTGQQAVGLTALGRATCRPVPSRAGAHAGDGVWLTGPVGAAMLGFEALRDGTGADSAAYRRPAPRLFEGRALAPYVTAMMDVSDGLLLDASRIATASGVTIAITAADVPLPVHLPATRADDAMRWGDDYELLFTLPDGMAPPVHAFRIGTVMRQGDSPVLLDGAVPHGQMGFLHS